MGKKSRSEKKKGVKVKVQRGAGGGGASEVFLQGGGGGAAEPISALPAPGAPLRTSSPSLQAKLDQLVALASADDRAGFVAAFVPLDLSAQDAEGYLGDLTTAPEAEGQWTNLVAEIAAIATGTGVVKIEGDQVCEAVFFFWHPLLEGCDREVAFVSDGTGEWRAQG